MRPADQLRRAAYAGAALIAGSIGALITARRQPGTPHVAITATPPPDASQVAVPGKVSSFSDADAREIAMLDAAAEDERETRGRIRRHILWVRVVPSCIAIVCILLFGSQLASVVYAWSVPSGTEVKPDSLWTSMHRGCEFLTGRVTPVTSLTVVSAVLATVVAINIAISADNRRASRRDTLEYGLWRRYYGGASIVIAVIAGLFGFAQWFSIKERGDGGTAMAATFLAGATLWLAWVSIGRASEFDHARNFADAGKRLESLADWKELLIVQHRVPLREVRTYKELIMPTVKVAAAVAGAAVAYTIAVFVILLAVYGFNPSATWLGIIGRIALLCAMNAGLSIAVAYMVYTPTVSSWSSPTTRPRWKLTVRPIIVRSIFIPFMFLMIWSVSAVDLGPWRALRTVPLMSTAFLLTPIAIWVTLRLSRRNRPSAWSRWLAAPVWDAVAQSLHSSHTAAEQWRLRAYNDHIESRHSEPSAARSG